MVVEIIVRDHTKLIFPDGITIKEARDAIGTIFGMFTSFETGNSYLRQNEKLYGRYEFWFIYPEPGLLQEFFYKRVPPFLMPLSFRKDELKKTIERKTYSLDIYSNGRKRYTYSKNKTYKWNCCEYMGQDHPLKCYKPKIHMNDENPILMGRTPCLYGKPKEIVYVNPLSIEQVKKLNWPIINM